LHIGGSEPSSRVAGGGLDIATLMTGMRRGDGVMMVGGITLA
jgi:hypothetical protein